MDIRHLQLATSALTQQRDFYRQLLGDPGSAAAAAQFSIQVGDSRLTFTQAPAMPQGRCHFAFNIPENQFDDARAWISRHVPLITDQTGATTFPFPNWDAHSVYFYDPAGNIVELIARHTLRNASDLPFSGRSLLNISEIGIAAEDVPARVAAIQATIHVPIYDGDGSQTFTAVGDEHGLLIVVQRGRMWFPNTGAPAEHLPITIEVATGTEVRTLTFP